MLGKKWKENLKNLSQHALLLGTSEYVIMFLVIKNWNFLTLPPRTSDYIIYEWCLKVCNVTLQNDLLPHVIISKKNTKKNTLNLWMLDIYSPDCQWSWVNFWLKGCGSTQDIIDGPDCTIDTIQDFLCKLGMKPHMHLLEISIFSLNHVIVRPTKIIKDLCKAST